MSNNSDAGKAKFALLSIVLSVVGVALGFVFRTPVMDAFTPGTLLALVALPLSLIAVRDHDGNGLTMLAFFIATAASFLTVGMGAK